MKNEKNIIEKTIEFFSKMPNQLQEKCFASINPHDLPALGCNFAIGYFLKRMGYKIEYHKEIKINLNANNPKTPDWYVYGRQNIPEFFVEVFKYNPSEDLKKSIKKIDELSKRIKEIKKGYSIKIYFGENLNKTGSKEIKEFAQNVDKWLEKNPIKGDILSITNSIRFKILEKSGKLINNKTSLYFNTWSDKSVLIDKIRKKIKKYKNVLKEFNFPIVLAPFFDFLSNVDFFDFNFKEDYYFRYVSAIIFLYKGFEGWKLEVLYNSNAKFPLPKNAFEKK